jgi:hypothetical protein
VATKWHRCLRDEVLRFSSWSRVAWVASFSPIMVGSIVAIMTTPRTIVDDLRLLSDSKVCCVCAYGRDAQA